MERMPRPVTIDTETFRITGRELSYPPRPVGVSIKYWGEEPTYYAFGHLDRQDWPAQRAVMKKEKWQTAENGIYSANERKGDCTLRDAIAAVKKAYAHPDGILFQNAKFDLDVIEKHMGIPVPDWSRVHDVIYLLFLHNPHARVLGLKQAAARPISEGGVLEHPISTDDQEAVANYLAGEDPVIGFKIKKNRSETSGFMNFIPWCPGRIVAEYANLDAIRTEALFEALWPKIAEAEMLDAYDRERELLPILLDMERRGIRIDTERLAQDIFDYQENQKRLEAWMRKRLGITVAEFKFTQKQKLGEYMDGAEVVNTSLMGRTPTGALKMDKLAMERGLRDPTFGSAYRHWAQLQTCLNTFMIPWLRTAAWGPRTTITSDLPSADDAVTTRGFIYTSWNQTRSIGGGTRTGRFSSSRPNFQNMPNEFAPLWAHEVEHLPAAKRPKLPKLPPMLAGKEPLKPLPLCRGYIVPLKNDHVLAGRDYSQQEPRILAHFESGALMERYNENPWMDFHDDNRAQVSLHLGVELARKPIKNIGLGLIYGQGAASLALKNDQPIEEVKRLRTAILGLYPGLDVLNASMRRKANAKVNTEDLGEFFTTWGGRRYFCEPKMTLMKRPKDGQGNEYGEAVPTEITFEYKMVNALIQGSAADCTKEAIIRYDRELKRLGITTHYLILLVHDELVVSMPKAELAWGIQLLRRCMESVSEETGRGPEPFEVKILSEGVFSTENWGAMKPYDTKGKIIANLNGLPKQKKAA